MHPEIHTWWPNLSIAAKHEMDETAGAQLPEIVRDEIAQITGHRVEAGTALSEEDARFIEIQREMVD